MRLTLRTLLSYLDDTLEPAQAKAIGAKVAESEQARDLMERIKQVTRRRRLTTPTTTGPGGIDPNTIAEYLDNEVTPEQSAEVEQICLASDVHLAEVAACHQILTLVLGEPALVPPSAKQRMYGLVKGPESIPFRKPSKTPTKDDLDLSSDIDADNDDTLRMGVPAVGGGKGIPSKTWLYIGGGALVAGLLVFAFWQLINSIPSRPGDANKDVVAQGDKDKDKDKDKEKDKDGAKDDRKKSDSAKDGGKDKDKTRDEKDKKEEIPAPVRKTPNTLPEVKPVAVTPPEVTPPPDIPYVEASKKQAPFGKYVAPTLKEPNVLLQSRADKGEWTRIAGKDADVLTGAMLMALPGSKSVVDAKSGVELTLWGNLWEVTHDPLHSESRATVHAHDLLDLDVTLDRGRILVRNKKKNDQEANIRVRFQDPMEAKELYFDIHIHAGGAVVIERSSEMDRDEPFYEDPKNPLRKGPIANMRVLAFAGVSSVRFGQSLPHSLDANQNSMGHWQNRQGTFQMQPLKAAPSWFKGLPPSKDKGDLLAREKAIEAHDYLARLMDKDNKEIGVALAEIVQTVQKSAQKEVDKQKTISLETYVLWRHAIRCTAAIDDVNNLFETFTHDTTPFFVRGLCMMALQQWLPQGRDHDYDLLKAIRDNNIKKTPSIKIMERFHFISAADAAKPATYQHLIEELNNDLLPIRMLSHFHLTSLAPAGLSIPYDPAMPRAMRQAAVQAWMNLIPPGQLPPAPKTPKTPKTPAK